MLFLDMNNSEQIFAIALGLEDPWSIKEIIFDQDKSQLDIYLEFTQESKFKMER